MPPQAPRGDSPGTGIAIGVVAVVVFIVVGLVGTDEDAGGDQHPVVAAASDERGKVVPPGGEGFEDRDQVVQFEIDSGGFTGRSAVRTQLAVQVLPDLDDVIASLP